jgi:rSAM/selenodomain-associated transferase 1
MTLRLGIAIFVKTPGRSPLKTRLAAVIGPGAAQQFHMLAAHAVAAVACQAQRKLHHCVAHWAVAEAVALDDPAWGLLPRIDQGEGDLGERMGNVTEQLLAHFDVALLLGADTPQITATDIIAAAHGLDVHQHVLGPSEDGGFWLFATHGGVPPPAWAATPWSQAETAARFCNALGAASIGCLRRLRDVDIADDLTPLLRDLDALEKALPEQQRLAEWLRATLR